MSTDPAQCAICQELEAKGRAPEHRTGGGSAALYLLIKHHRAEHGTEGKVVTGCRECYTYLHDPPRIPVADIDEYSEQHFVMHALGIVWDGPGFPLRFSDMPARTSYAGPPGRQWAR